MHDGDVGLVDRWYTDKRRGPVHSTTFPALIGTEVQTPQDRVHHRDVAWIRSWV